MKRRIAAATALGLAWAAGAWAQGSTTPFDMSGERPADTPQAVPAAPTSPPAALPSAPEQNSQATLPPETPQPAAAAAPAPAPGLTRFILPTGRLTLGGEVDRRAWSLYLSRAQAASPARLNLGYQNAVVVAPEASKLEVRLNGQTVASQALASSESVASLGADLPAGLLREGWNDIEIKAVQRHRTDCTVQSTYELWTEIDPGQSFLRFTAPDAARLADIDDLRSVGAGASGETRINLVVPGISAPAATAPAMRLAEGLALMTDMPNQAVSVLTAPAAGGGATGPGVLNVLMGTPADLAGLARTLPAGGGAAGLAMVDDSVLGPSTLLVSGPTWPAIASAVEGFVTPLDRGRVVQRTVIATRPWRIPEPPMLFDEARLNFGELGIPTEEFAGRRFRTDFALGVPADFYAQSYGEATILLDAAYSADVEPGSRIDIYVNGSIASTMPIVSSGGAILRHLPIKVPLRHFRPGINTVVLEAVMMTQADTLCAPGTTALPERRFVLFDTSEWRMPSFARIRQVPNLSALGGTGAPYGRSPAPVSVMLDRSDVGSFSAAATLLARMSVAAGRPLEIDLNASPAASIGRNALFVGPIASIAPEVLQQVGVAQAARTDWSAEDVKVAESTERTDETFERWRDELTGSDWRGQVSLFQDWLDNTFGVTRDSLQLRPQDAEEFSPGGDVNFMVAQNMSPNGDGTWTVATAPSGTALAEGAASFTRQIKWGDLSGHITAYNSGTERVSHVAVGSYRLMDAAPASLSNYRLIAANWLSANVLGYSMALGGFAVGLGLVTALLLSALGRRS